LSIRLVPLVLFLDMGQRVGGQLFLCTGGFLSLSQRLGVLGLKV
jgi:hypothetical protein